MIFPNKLINFQNCTLYKTTYILEELSLESLGILKLYDKVKKHFEDLDQFILTLDILYLLEKIEYDTEWRTITYVKNDKMQ